MDSVVTLLSVATLLLWLATAVWVLTTRWRRERHLTHSNTPETIKRMTESVNKICHLASEPLNETQVEAIHQLFTGMARKQSNE